MSKEEEGHRYRRIPVSAKSRKSSRSKGRSPLPRKRTNHDHASDIDPLTLQVKIAVIGRNEEENKVVIGKIEEKKDVIGKLICMARENLPYAQFDDPAPVINNYLAIAGAGWHETNAQAISVCYDVFDNKLILMKHDAKTDVFMRWNVSDLEEWDVGLEVDLCIRLNIGSTCRLAINPDAPPNLLDRKITPVDPKFIPRAR